MPATTAVPTVEESASHGRVDADGVVLVTVDGAERRVGEWKAGTPEEGLTHFARRYTDLATQVEVLAARLTTHPEDAATVAKDAAKLRDGLATADVVGDISALDRRLVSVLDDAAAAQNRVEERRARLVDEAEKVAEGTDWKADGDRLRAIADEAASLGVSGALRSRLRKARETFNRRRGAHFSELDNQRDAVRREKEKLVERAVALQNSTDWAATARAYRDLMTEWKAAGRARRADDDRLWEQFRAAQDVFFGARDEDNRRRDAELADNADAKQWLLDEYDARIDPAADLDRARDLLRELQEKWDEAGYVPRDRMREFDEKIGALESRVSDYAEEQWRRTDPEVEARVAQFRAKVDQLTAEADSAEKAGRAKKAAELRAQAEQWNEWASTAAEAARG